MLALALLGACGDPPAAPDGEAAASGVAMEAPAEGSERARTLGPFLAAHWTLPVPAQGEAPVGWGATERSLHPDDCRSCHPRQWEEWRTSLHAGAFSPGFAGQLIEGGLAAPDAVRGCQTCHTPLEEQQPWGASGAANPRHDPALREAGLVCAGCHVRAHRRLGPPRRPGLPPLPEAPPHGGFEARAEFQESRFCAPCHQFFDQGGPNGKPVENTFAEWRASPQAEAGRTCQACHMPGRAHLWRGIHDPGMVRSGVDVALDPVEVRGGEVRTALRVANRDVGHAFPTYVTPRVLLEAWQEGAAGDEIEGTHRIETIGRKIDFSSWEEVFDTRVLPGESRALDYAAERAPGAAALVARVTVDPDFHYRGVFEGYLPTLSDPEAKRLIAQALERSRRSRFVLFEERRPLGEGDAQRRTQAP